MIFYLEQASYYIQLLAPTNDNVTNLIKQWLPLQLVELRMRQVQQKLKWPHLAEQSPLPQLENSLKYFVKNNFDTTNIILIQTSGTIVFANRENGKSLPVGTFAVLRVQFILSIGTIDWVIVNKCVVHSSCTIPGTRGTLTVGGAVADIYKFTVNWGEINNIVSRGTTTRIGDACFIICS